MAEHSALRPPVEVMRPTAVRELPAADDPDADPLQYSLKMDGFRAVAFALGGRTVLQSRSSRDLAPDFPSLAANLTRVLNPGAVLDGEICAWSHGRLQFTELLSTEARRRAAGTALIYVAFDCLAIPSPEGGRDIRALPLAERWQHLLDQLRDTSPYAQQVMTTENREEALLIADSLTSVGIEGIVAKRLDSPYRPDRRSAWVKWRHAETVDGRILGIVGPIARPHAVLVELDDGTRKVTSPRLDPSQSRRVAEAVAGRLGEAERTTDGLVVHAVTDGPLAEVHQGTGRHATTRFVRIRSEDGWTGRGPTRAWP
ncbi:DNA ligase (plasmid) [Streptomyces globisporus]|uniref:ATP-dependent DNA ligase n=1 Tax=Streptomyces globisporus TaxID=1908 RepID=UPI002F90C5CF|nr:DNA ligase [Streptomyces globisporus]